MAAVSARDFVCIANMQRCELYKMGVSGCRNTMWGVSGVAPMHVGGGALLGKLYGAPCFLIAALISAIV